MAKKQIQLLIAVVVVIAAAGWAYRSNSGPSVKFDLTPYNALGNGTAAVTAKLIGNQGQVVVVALDTREFNDPVMEGQLKSFEQALQKTRVKIAGTTRFKLTPMERMGTGGAVPAALLAKAMQEHPGLSALVLFCPYPMDFVPPKPGEPKFVVASGYLPVYRRLIEAQLISAAIVPRFDRAETTSPKAKTLKDSFEEEFVVVTPENLTSLPY
ncbi:MAG: hypothetical protein ABIQ35_04230 [Verrucomicrobiota bacterium]